MYFILCAGSKNKKEIRSALKILTEEQERIVSFIIILSHFSISLLKQYFLGYCQLFLKKHPLLLFKHVRLVLVFEKQNVRLWNFSTEQKIVPYPFQFKNFKITVKNVLQKVFQKSLQK